MAEHFPADPKKAPKKVHTFSIVQRATVSQARMAANRAKIEALEKAAQAGEIKPIFLPRANRPNDPEPADQPMDFYYPITVGKKNPNMIHAGRLLPSGRLRPWCGAGMGADRHAVIMPVDLKKDVTCRNCNLKMLRGETGPKAKSPAPKKEP